MSQQQNYNYRQHVNSILQAPTAQFPDRTFTLKQLLGEGGEGGIYLANPQKWGNCTTQIVLKLQLKMKEQEMEFIDNIKQYQEQHEIPNTPQYHPSYIIRIYERFQWRGMEVTLMEKGEIDLYNYLQQNFKQLTIQDKTRICYQVFQPIFFLKSQRLLHRDIKPDNYVKVGNDFKLIDFGLVKQNQESLTKGIGSKLYQAPELRSESAPSEKSDIWSLGCVFFEIFSGICIFDCGQEFNLEVLEKLIQQYYMDQDYFDQKINDLQITDDLKTLLKGLLQCDEKKRVNLQFVQNYFSKYQINSQTSQTQQQQLRSPVSTHQINPMIQTSKIGNSMFQTYSNNSVNQAYNNISNNNNIMQPQPQPQPQPQIKKYQQNSKDQVSIVQEKFQLIFQQFYGNLKSNTDLSKYINQILQSYLNKIDNLTQLFSSNSQQNFIFEEMKQFDLFLEQIIQQMQIFEWLKQIQLLNQQTKIWILQQENLNVILELDQQYQNLKSQNECSGVQQFQNYNQNQGQESSLNQNYFPDQKSAIQQNGTQEKINNTLNNSFSKKPSVFQSQIITSSPQNNNRNQSQLLNQQLPLKTQSVVRFPQQKKQFGIQGNQNEQEQQFTGGS